VRRGVGCGQGGQNGSKTLRPVVANEREGGIGCSQESTGSFLPELGDGFAFDCGENDFGEKFTVGQPVQRKDDVVDNAVVVALQASSQGGVAYVDAECYSDGLADKRLNARNHGGHGELVEVVVRGASEKIVVDWN
jgi:hypothetical protein